MGLVLRLVLIAVVLLVVLSLLRNLVRRVSPLGEGNLSPGRARLAAWLDRGVMQARRVARVAVWVVLTVIVVKLVVVHLWLGSQERDAAKSQQTR